MTNIPSVPSEPGLPLTAKIIYTPGAHDSGGGTSPTSPEQGRSRMKRKNGGGKSISGFEYLLTISRKTGRYAGEWVGIVDRRIVAHGKDARAVYKKRLKLYPGREPGNDDLTRDAGLVDFTDF